MIQCFLIEQTNLCARLLRRFGPSCPNGLHDAHAFLEIAASDTNPPWGNNHPHDDPRWPASYPCGCPVQPSDSRQACWEHIWRDAQGREFIIDMDLPNLPIAPPGAMWRSPWYENIQGWGGPDGHVYTVRTPGGDWVVDAPPSNGSRWTRTGTPPILTVTPSILAGRGKNGAWLYHGFLTNGFLVPC
jgi:hypothetical protein